MDAKRVFLLAALIGVALFVVYSIWYERELEYERSGDWNEQAYADSVAFEVQELRSDSMFVEVSNLCGWQIDNVKVWYNYFGADSAWIDVRFAEIDNLKPWEKRTFGLIVPNASNITYAALHRVEVDQRTFR